MLLVRAARTEQTICLIARMVPAMVEMAHRAVKEDPAGMAALAETVVI